MNKSILLLLVLAFYVSLDAQQAVLLDDIEVFNQGRQIANPWAGGLKAGQFSKIDLDNDGVKDLVVFDRNSSILSTYINEGGPGEINYAYAPEYAKIFPKALTFLLMHDFNGDGIEDVFKDPTTTGVAGIEVWRGKRDANGLYFELVRNDTNLAEVLYVANSNGVSQVYNSNIDIPGIFDVDGDGDTDILTFESQGTYLNYYRNQAIEKNLGLDTFDFAYSLSDPENFCFGKFKETMLSSEVILSPTSTECATGFAPHPNNNGGPRHAGSTVTAFDYECDGDADIILGDFLTNSITFLRNTGSPNNSLITEQDINFPSYDTPADMEVFLSTFYLDINNDDNKDLIVTPNQTEVGKNQNHVWLYLNEGTTCDPIFKLERKDFLINRMLHFSSTSHPQFADYNADGLMDILVATGREIVDGLVRNKEIYVLENIGTPTIPKFNIVTNDYLSVSQLPEDVGSLALDIADIDNDGDLDLFLGHSAGELFFYENIAGPGAPFLFDDPVASWMDFFIGTNSSPDFYDFDGDGLLDLTFGEANNEFNMFRNIGTKEEPMFNSDPNSGDNIFQFGNIYCKNNFDTKRSNPVFFKNKDELQLLQGVNTGAIRLFNNIIADTLESFNLLEANFGDIFVGFRPTVDVADINGNGRYEMAVGNHRGGLHIYGTNLVRDPALNVNEPISIIEGRIFPNPVRQELNLDVDISGEGELQVFSSTGQLVRTKEISGSFNIINLQDLNPGLYHLVILASEGRFTSTFIKVE